jgi:hypothetical protein
MLPSRGWTQQRETPQDDKLPLIAFMDLVVAVQSGERGTYQAFHLIDTAARSRSPHSLHRIRLRSAIFRSSFTPALTSISADKSALWPHGHPSRTKSPGPRSATRAVQSRLALISSISTSPR